MFIQKGKKKLASKHINKALLMIKYEYKITPLLLFLEMLEILKPVFRLRKYIVRRTVVKQYPYIAKASRRYMVAVRWVKDEIVNSYNKDSSIEPLYLRVFSKLSSFKVKSRKHPLLKIANRQLREVLKNQGNMRFN